MWTRREDKQSQKNLAIFGSQAWKTTLTMISVIHVYHLHISELNSKRLCSCTKESWPQSVDEGCK